MKTPGAWEYREGSAALWQMEVSTASRSWGAGTEYSGLSSVPGKLPRGPGEARGELAAEQPPWQRASQMLAWENRKVLAAQVTQWLQKHT